MRVPAPTATTTAHLREALPIPTPCNCHASVRVLAHGCVKASAQGCVKASARGAGAGPHSGRLSPLGLRERHPRVHRIWAACAQIAGAVSGSNSITTIAAHHEVLGRDLFCLFLGVARERAAPRGCFHGMLAACPTHMQGCAQAFVGCTFCLHEYVVNVPPSKLKLVFSCETW